MKKLIVIALLACFFSGAKPTKPIEIQLDLDANITRSRDDES